MSHPRPDPATATRMRRAHLHARTQIGLMTADPGVEHWGWHGRTISGPVTTQHGPGWLRVASAPRDDRALTFWNGTLDAHRALPPELPRPRLLAHHDWDTDTHHYRAELTTRLDHPALSPTSAPAHAPNTSLPWWADLRHALRTLASVRTTRHTVTPDYLRHAMPAHLAVCPDLDAITWGAAHGDLHWANLHGPHLHIVDWEGWGLAPYGYDAAVLHTHSLRHPDLARRVRIELADQFDTPDGHFAELVAITEVLDSALRGDHVDLAVAVRNRARVLLSR